MSSEYDSRGWPFPPAFMKTAECIPLVTREEDIAESIDILLHTRVGERFLVPNYGCNIMDMVFEIIGESGLSHAYIKDVIGTALALHEQRVTLDDVTVNSVPDRGELSIELHLTVVATGLPMTVTVAFTAP